MQNILIADLSTLRKQTEILGKTIYNSLSGLTNSEGFPTFQLIFESKIFYSNIDNVNL